jgi:hypothetical protein
MGPQGLLCFLVMPRLWWATCGLLAVLATAAACSGDDRPEKTDPGGGDNGRGGNGGDVSSDSGGESPISPTGSGGTDTGEWDWAACHTLDPGRVYLLGVLTEGNGVDSVALPESPSDICAAVYSHYDGVIRPTDGSLMYIDWEDGHVRSFVADAFVYNADLDQWQYAEDPLANDGVIQAACGSGRATFGIKVNPETGETYHQCGGDTDYYDESGQVVEPGDGTILHFGYGGHRLLRVGTGAFAVQTADGTVTEVQEVEAEEPAAIRAGEDGFWVVLRGDEDELTRWHISHDGAAELQGSYAAPPADYRVSWETDIDGEGNIYQTASGPESGEDAIIKRPLSPATSTVVYTEARTPDWAQDWENRRFFIKMHGSNLVTGP